jgi:dynein heavy chain
MTIEEWEREVKMFHRLRQIPFFAKYKIWKNYSLWKKYTRRNIMKDRSKLLSQHLFFLDKHLRRPLLEVRNICLHLSKLEYMDLSSSEPVKYDDFRTLQENYRVTLMDKKFDTLENAIKDLILNSCSTSLISFKEENRIPNKDPDNPSADQEEPAPLLVGDETNKEMPYTQEATIRTHYKRLRKFIKLVDYLVLNGKLSMMNFSSELLFRSITEHNSSVKDPKRNARINCWLICEIGMRDKDLTFTPNKEITRKIFEEVVMKGIQRICNKHRQLIHYPELMLYTHANESEEDNNEELIDIQTLIDSDESFKTTRTAIRSEVEVSFENLVTFAQFLIPYILNFHQNASIQISEYENKEIDELKALIAQFKKQDQEFQAIEGKTELGLFLMDNQALKDYIKGSAAGCLTELTKMMPEMVFKRSKAFVEILTDLNNKLSWTPNELPMQFVEQFVTFSDNVQQISQKMEVKL